jgi:rare lipoprotein A
MNGHGRIALPPGVGAQMTLPWRWWLATGVAALLAGCAATPKPAPGPELPRPPSGKGGYYQDDGPGENPPPNLLATPDAVPRDEPPQRFSNRPYEVLGSNYTPDLSDKPYKQKGIASWYGRKFHGKKTASGESYDMYGMTAAHRTLPIPSYVRVTNPKNNQSVVVRVNDRGPFHASRIIDLSYTAALKLGLVGTGSGPVEVERVFASDGPNGTLAQSNVAPAVPAASVSDGGPRAVAADPTPLKGSGLYVQLGAFGTLGGAQGFRDKIQQDLTWLAEGVQILARNGLYRVRLGPYPTRTEASAIADKIRETLDFTPHIAPQ